MFKVLIRVFVLVAMTISLLAAPDRITYQGKLLEGTIPANGQYEVQVAIYSDDAGTVKVWPLAAAAEYHGPLTVVNGLYTIVLGETYPIEPSVFAGSQAYLKIEVKKTTDGGYTALAPLTRLYSVPYSLQAEKASSLSGGAADQILTSDGTNGSWVNSLKDSQVDDNLTIFGGTVNNTVIGGTVPAAGTFTDLRVTDADGNQNFRIGSSPTENAGWAKLYTDALNEIVIMGNTGSTSKFGSVSVTDDQPGA
jgi:hypothetical protein